MNTNRKLWQYSANVAILFTWCVVDVHVMRSGTDGIL